jgi:hypothetical protein
MTSPTSILYSFLLPLVLFCLNAMLYVSHANVTPFGVDQVLLQRHAIRI